MAPREINCKLLELIPNIKALFDEVTSWQDGLDTGSTIVIEDVFMVYLKMCIEKNKTQEIESCSSFIEWLTEHSEEEYAGDVLVVSVFEYIRFATDREKLV